LGIVANYHGGNIVSKAAAEELGENFKGNPIGTGPFAYDELADGQFLKLTAHEGFFRGAPSVEGVTIRFIPQSSARELAFRNGEIDAFYGTREDRWINRFKGEGHLDFSLFSAVQGRFGGLKPEGRCLPGCFAA
jgi:peptide/nickel transport system substrate-binding protein